MKQLYGKMGRGGKFTTRPGSRRFAQESRGIKSELKEIYLAAKQYGRIIVSLESGVEKMSGRKMPQKDWRPDVEAIVKASNKLKGQGVPIQSEAFALLKASARIAQAAVSSPDDLDGLWKKFNRVQSSVHKLEDALMRAEMLREEEEEL